jgi:hypothetical protein
MSEPINQPSGSPLDEARRGLPQPGSPSRGSERVKSWLYAIVNPWIEVMTFEESRLLAGQISFRAGSRRLEHLRPLRAQLRHDSGAILDDLARVYPEVRDWEREHDELLAQLTVAATGFYDSLETRPELSSQIAHWSQGHQNVLSLDAIQTTIRQHIVNNASSIDSQDATQFLWNPHRQEWLRLREDEAATAMTTATKVLRDSDLVAREGLEKLRWHLVDQFDIPAARL